MKSKAMAIGVRTRISYCALAIMTIILSMGENTMAQTKSTTVVRNVVIVHGGLVDGSGWEAVYNLLKKDGYTVTIVQNPTISLADDVAFTKRAIAALNGPVILVGHSYGGGAGLCRCLCARQRRICIPAHQGPTSWRASTADPSSRRWLSTAREGKIPCVFRRRCESRKSRIHGRLASAVGCERGWRHHQRSGMEGKT
jgi:Alpha/beta hydrolase family